MARERGKLVPIAVKSAPIWPGPVQALQPSSSARRGFTQADQVHQLVSASEADPDLGFMALCSLPRTNPGNQHQYKRANGPFHALHERYGRQQTPLRQSAPLESTPL